MKNLYKINRALVAKKKLFTLFSAMLFAAGVFAATEQAWYNDVTSITNNGQYYIYSVNGKGFMQANKSSVKAVNNSNYTSNSDLLFTVTGANDGKAYSNGKYVVAYQTHNCGPVGGSNDDGSNLIWTSMSSGAYWNIHGHYTAWLAERWAALYFDNGYEATANIVGGMTTQTDAKYRWYLISPAQYDRHFAIYLFDEYKESLDIAQYSGLVPAAYYTALETAYNQTFSVQNVEHSAEVVNAAKATLEGLYNGAADVAAAYATATTAINTLAAVEDKGEDFAEVTTDINNANSALEQATTVEAVNAAVANLKAIDPVTFNTTTFTALQSIGTPAASAAARAITFDATDKTIINADGMALKAGTTTLTASAAATAQYYKFVRSAQVTVNKAQTLVVPVELSFCEGSSVTYRGTEYTQAGEHDVQAAGEARDTTYHVTVTVLLPSASEESKTIAYGAGETWNGYDLGTYEVGMHNLQYTATNMAGCDSVVTLHLTVTKQDVEMDTVAFVFCEGDSVEYRGVWYDVTGSFNVEVPGEVRDTLITVVVTVNAHAATDTYATATAGELFTLPEGEWHLRGEEVVTSYYPTKADADGVWFEQNLQTVHGCDSVVTLYVDVLQYGEPVVLEQNLFFCPGESVEYRDIIYFEVGKDTIHVEDEVRDTLIYVTVATLEIDGTVFYDTVAAGDAITFPEGEWYLGNTRVESYTTSEADVPELKFIQYTEMEGCEVIVEYIVTVTSREGVENVFVDQSAEKFFRNGVLFIRRGDALYTATGERVE